MSEYNPTAAAVREAHEKPVLVIGRLRYTGRLLSIEEWLPFYERQVEIERLREEEAKAQRAPALRPSIELWVDYLRAVFPKRGRFSWFAPDPVAWLRKQPGAEIREAYYHFFFLQARALGWELAGRATDGKSSSSSTPAADTSPEE